MEHTLTRADILPTTGDIVIAYDLDGATDIYTSDTIQDVPLTARDMVEIAEWCGKPWAIHAAVSFTTEALRLHRDALHEIDREITLMRLRDRALALQIELNI